MLPSSPHTDVGIRCREVSASYNSLVIPNHTIQHTTIRLRPQRHRRSKMCIVLLTTAHPSYALILIDNRDEFVQRPTSRPQWWRHPASGREVLSSRDLHRREQGTWLGVTRDGLLAVLTNYRESQADQVQGARSRGGMVTSWLGGLPEGGVMDGVRKLVGDDGVKGVGGFSMLCGKLRRAGEGIAIVSNRAGDVNDVPLIGEQRGQVWGLSNAAFSASSEWPKVRNGKALLKAAAEAAASQHLSQEDLVASLFAILDTDTLPPREPGTTLIQHLDQLRHSIFVPPLGDDAGHRQAMSAAMARKEAGEAPGPKDSDADLRAAELLRAEERPDGNGGGTAAFETGAYGTQRQTVVLVDWEGNLTLVERALWDEAGNAVQRGDSDVTFRFKIDGWDD